MEFVLFSSSLIYSPHTQQKDLFLFEKIKFSSAKKVFLFFDLLFYFFGYKLNLILANNTNVPSARIEDRNKPTLNNLFPLLARLTKEVNHAYENSITKAPETPQTSLNRYSLGHTFAFFVNILRLKNIIRKGFDLMVSYKKYLCICDLTITANYISGLFSELHSCSRTNFYYIKENNLQ